MCETVCGGERISAPRYFSLKRNKNVNSFQKMKLFVKYVDTAAYKYYNSAGNVSKTLFHRGEYGKLIVKARM